MNSMVLLFIVVTRVLSAWSQATQPQAILVLEGERGRVPFAGKLAVDHPELPIIVSGNLEALEINRLSFARAGVDHSRIKYEGCAVDTVTNFTCNVSDLQRAGVPHVYIVTSAYHMPRALAIASVVLWSHGIAFTPVEVPGGRHFSEGSLRIARDVVRSLVWLGTGLTGASLNPRLYSFTVKKTLGSFIYDKNQ